MELKRNVFATDGREALGTFDYGDYRIEIDDDLHDAKLLEVMTHELCHALDRTAGLSSETQPDVLALTEQATTESFLVHPRDPRETFAEICEGGPAISALASTSCPGDAVDASAAARWVHEFAWRGKTVRTPPSLVVDYPLSTPTLASGIDRVEAGADGGVARFNLLGPRPMAFVDQVEFVPPYSYYTVELSTRVQVASEDYSFGENPPTSDPGWSLPDGLEISTHELTGQTIEIDGRGAMFTAPLPGLAPRILHHEDGGWAAVGGACPNPGAYLFEADGERYAAWPDEERYAAWPNHLGLLAGALHPLRRRAEVGVQLNGVGRAVDRLIRKVGP